MLRRVSLSVFAALAVSLPASALELDRIEVKSGIGQPLRAEIPVVSAAPSELRKLRAQLASPATFARIGLERRSEEHTSELQSLMRISYAVFCLKKKKNQKHKDTHKVTNSTHRRK